MSWLKTFDWKQKNTEGIKRRKTSSPKEIGKNAGPHKLVLRK